MKIETQEFRVREGAKINLRKWPTKVASFYKSKEQARDLLVEHVGRLSSVQKRFFASDRYALLVIFQGMDAAGKDGAIQQVMSGVNPLGCRVYSFKQPTPTERQHDFLWRT